MNINKSSILIKEKKTCIAFALTISLITVSLFYSFLIVFAFGVSLYMLITEEPDRFMIYFISLLPWAYIYKFNGISTSLFVVLSILTTIRYLFYIRYFNKLFCALVIILIIFVLSRMRIFDGSMAFMFLKFIIYLVLLYEFCVLHKAKNISAILLFFSLSVIIASVLAYVVPDRALFNERISSSIKLVEHQYNRFKGLQNDPNYYNSSLVISILFMSFLFIKKELNLIFYIVLSGLCVFFGFLTYSKSFLVLLFMVLTVVVYYSLKQKRYWVFMLLLIISIVAILFVVSGKFEMANIIIRRFSGSAGFTSGRFDIWEMYFSHFKNDLLLLLFGNGFESIVLETHAAHNTFIDLIYCLGLLGSIIVLCIVGLCYKQNSFNSKNIFGYLFMLFILFEFLSLSCLTTCEFPLLLFFVFMFFSDENYNDSIKGERIEIENKNLTINNNAIIEDNNENK